MADVFEANCASLVTSTVDSKPPQIAGVPGDDAVSGMFNQNKPLI